MLNVRWVIAVLITFTQLNFAGYEREITIEVPEYKAISCANGTYNVSYNKDGERYLFENCTQPKRVAKTERKC